MGLLAQKQNKSDARGHKAELIICQAVHSVICSSMGAWPVDSTLSRGCWMPKQACGRESGVVYQQEISLPRL